MLRWLLLRWLLLLLLALPMAAPRARQTQQSPWGAEKS